MLEQHTNSKILAAGSFVPASNCEDAAQAILTTRSPKGSGSFLPQILALNRKTPHVCQGDAADFARRHNLKVLPLGVRARVATAPPAITDGLDYAHWLDDTCSQVLDLPSISELHPISQSLLTHSIDAQENAIAESPTPVPIQRTETNAMTMANAHPSTARETGPSLLEKGTTSQNSGRPSQVLTVAAVMPNPQSTLRDSPTGHQGEVNTAQGCVSQVLTEGIR